MLFQFILNDKPKRDKNGKTGKNNQRKKKEARKKEP